MEEATKYDPELEEVVSIEEIQNLRRHVKEQDALLGYYETLVKKLKQQNVVQLLGHVEQTAVSVEWLDKVLKEYAGLEEKLRSTILIPIPWKRKKKSRDSTLPQGTKSKTGRMGDLSHS